MSWSDALQPASWRGLPFSVSGTTVKRGRRVAVHEYPYRDVVWVEDLGRAKREISFSAFILGDDLIGQQQAILDASEKAGAGDLVHPALGKRTVALLGLECTQRADLGRVVEISFSFLETANSPAYPNGSTATQSLVKQLAALVGGDIASDFAAVKGALAYGSSVAGSVLSEITSIANRITSIVRNPISSLLSLAGLGGGSSYGRFSFATISTAISAVTRAVSTVSGLFGGGTGPTAAAAIASATASKASAVQACIACVSAAHYISPLDTDSFASSVQKMVTSVAASTPAPADAIRLLGQVVAAASAPTNTANGLGAWMLEAQVATCSLVRRTAAIAMANAASNYVPTSYDDAVTIRDTVVSALDAEILVAGDAGEDRSYQTLRTVRAAVSNDLTTRAASLARIVTVTTQVSLPSVVDAWALYQDATRGDELVAEADPVHPAFMPTSFRALSR